MTKIDEIKKKNENYVMNTYGRLDIALERGEGTKVWDTEGNEYLDFLAGIAVTNLGHGHPKVVKAMQEQINKLLHTSNVYYIEDQAKLAEELVKGTCFGKAFFCNSGAEANEAAIKLARKYAKVKMNGQTEIITMKKSFHGRTLTTITATGQEKYQKYFTPLTEGFTYAEYGNIEDIRSKIGDNTIAVMIEVIQGEGGLNVLPPKFWKELEALIEEKKILLMIDEVQTGIGRTGFLYGYELYGLKPDIISLAKGLGNGMPIGAMLAKEEVAVYVPGDHASTFGGNHLATAASLAVIREIKSDNFLYEVRKKGEFFRSRLNDLKDKYKLIKDVRGKGLMIGVEFTDTSKLSLVMKKLQEEGILIGTAGGISLRFVPPLTVEKTEIDVVIAKLDKVLGEIK